MALGYRFKLLTLVVGGLIGGADVDVDGDSFNSKGNFS